MQEIFLFCNTSKLPLGSCLPVVVCPGHAADNSPPFSAKLRMGIDIPPLAHMLLWHEQGLILIFIYQETYISMTRTNQLVYNYFLFGEWCGKHKYTLFLEWRVFKHWSRWYVLVCHSDLSNGVLLYFFTWIMVSFLNVLKIVVYRI